MFKLAAQLARLANVNPRIEKHGDKNVGACDLKIEINLNNTALDSFNPAIRPFLYRPANESGDQPQLELADGGEQLTGIRMPHLSPLVLDEKWPGYTVRISASLGKAKPIVLEGAELSRFRFEAIEGGSVKITFAVAGHPTGPEIGKLSDLSVDGEIELTLEPPKADAQQALDAIDQGKEAPEEVEA